MRKGQDEIIHLTKGLTPNQLKISEGLVFKPIEIHSFERFTAYVKREKKSK